MTIDMPVESPQGNVLNYSIISSDEEENPLILKLKVSGSNKVSESNRVPHVVLKRLENASQYKYVVSPRSSNRSRKVKGFDGFEMESTLKVDKKESLTPRKRERTKKVDIIDVEMHSPTKIPRSQRTPQKQKNIDNNLDSLCMHIAEKVRLTTPEKRSFAKTDLFVGDNKKTVASPRKEGGDANVTLRRRGVKKLDDLTPTKIDENEGILVGKRRSCAPLRFAEEYSPQKSAKVNLNESFRRTVLKNRYNVNNMSEDSGVSKKGNTSPIQSRRQSSLGTRRNVRKSYAQNYYESDEDEAIQVAEALKKSEIEVSATKRVLRSRSSSTVPNESAITLSDSDYVKDTSLKSRRLTRSRRNSSKSNMDESPEKVISELTVCKTPITPRNRRQSIATLKSLQTSPKTPKNRLKMLREGVITPAMHSRANIVPGDNTPLMKARSQLHVSYVPTSLPCREREYLDVYNFLRGKLDDGCGGCMYISGVPGTGKTATVTSVIDSLVNDKEVPKFSYVSINGMRLTEPRQSYVEIWKQLTGKTVPWEQAQSLLEERFTKKKKLSPIVMLIDELDILCTKRQDVVYNLLDWPTKSKDQLIVITIANTMDLPERLLMSRVTSRLGLTRLTFQAYTHKQLMEIVTKRLMGTDSFNSDAVQLVARKVASVSGDARRALDICRRAAEVAEVEGNGQLVNIMHINEALTAMVTQPHVTAMRRCSRLQKLLLQAIVAEIERTGVEETTFSDVFRILVSCCALDGFKMVSSTVAQRALCQLSACKLILTDQKCSDIYQRIILNVSVHDVYFALKKE